MGAGGALGFFASVIFHELSHSLMARRYGLPMKGITLFIFGGVAEMEEKPPTAHAEFMIAIVGPLSSILLGLVFYGVYLMARGGDLSEGVVGVLAYLGLINGLLAAFNLVPVFLIDGGRILRSILWGWKFFAANLHFPRTLCYRSK